MATSLWQMGEAHSRSVSRCLRHLDCFVHWRLLCVLQAQLGGTIRCLSEALSACGGSFTSKRDKRRGDRALGEILLFRLCWTLLNVKVFKAMFESNFVLIFNTIQFNHGLDSLILNV